MKEIKKESIGRAEVTLDKVKNGPYLLAIVVNGVVRSEQEYAARVEALVAFQELVQKI